MEMGKWIIDATIENGATLAGIASMEALRVSASHTIYGEMGDYAGVGTVKDDVVLPGNRLFNWPESVRSVLVIALSHPKEKPELDWWDGRGTPGNRVLIDILERTSQQIESNLKIKTHKLHYYVEKGGVFLKDAAVLAGIGSIGRSNLLLTPSYGPMVRLRALSLEADLDPTGPISFDPCADCKDLCRKVCPEKATIDQAPIFKLNEFSEHLPGRDGAYNRQLCNIRMEKDIAEASAVKDGKQLSIKYCRKCELVCPAGK